MPDAHVITGDSAGANLAAAISLHMRDTGYKLRPKLQVLLYPALQMIDFLTPSYQEHAHDPLLRAEDAIRFILL